MNSASIMEKIAARARASRAPASAMPPVATPAPRPAMEKQAAGGGDPSVVGDPSVSEAMKMAQRNSGNPSARRDANLPESVKKIATREPGVTDDPSVAAAMKASAGSGGGSTKPSTNPASREHVRRVEPAVVKKVMEPMKTAADLHGVRHVTLPKDDLKGADGLNMAVTKRLTNTNIAPGSRILAAAAQHKTADAKFDEDFSRMLGVDPTGSTDGFVRPDVKVAGQTTDRIDDHFLGWMQKKADEDVVRAPEEKTASADAYDHMVAGGPKAVRKAVWKARAHGAAGVIGAAALAAGAKALHSHGKRKGVEELYNQQKTATAPPSDVKKPVKAETKDLGLGHPGQKVIDGLRKNVQGGRPLGFHGNPKLAGVIQNPENLSLAAMLRARAQAPQGGCSDA
jgi:hypothetical protein